MAVVPPPLYSRAATGPFDVSGLPHATGVKNLLLVGRENLPGLGLEGELVSGWGAARLVGHAPRPSRVVAATHAARKVGHS